MAEATVSVSVVDRSKLFVQEAVAELKKVTWPDWEQLRSATTVVLIFVIGISVVIWVMDVIVRTLVNAVMGIFGA
jgi:preprotein translocase subunit SecE